MTEVAPLLQAVAARLSELPEVKVGVLEAGEELVIESHMPDGGVIFSDGVERDALGFNSGALATIKAADRQTKLVAA